MAQTNVYGSGKYSARRFDPLNMERNPLVVPPREFDLPDGLEYEEVDRIDGFLRARMLEQHIGIVPIGGVDMGGAHADLPWEPAYAAISDTLLACERAVLECAYADCTSIWVVATESVGTLLRERLGEYCVATWTREGNEDIGKIIPVYYIPYHSHDAIFRPWTSWAILYAYWTVTRIFAEVSAALLPLGAYVAFPMACYPPETAKALNIPLRKDGGEVHYPSLLHDGGGIREGKMVGFFIDELLWYAAADVYSNSPTLPVRYAKHFDLPKWQEAAVEHGEAHYAIDKVFADVVYSKDVIDVPWYYDIRTFEGYRSYLSDPNAVIDGAEYERIGGRKLYEYEAISELDEE